MEKNIVFFSYVQKLLGIEDNKYIHVYKYKKNMMSFKINDWENGFIAF